MVEHGTKCIHVYWHSNIVGKQQCSFAKQPRERASSLKESPKDSVFLNLGGFESTERVKQKQ